MRDLELRSANEKLADESKSRSEAEKNQKALKAQVTEAKDDLEKELLARKKAEAVLAETQSQVKVMAQVAEGDKGKAELEQMIKAKEALIKSLKDALEKECQENDEAVEVLENKVLGDKKKYMAVIDELKLELEKMKANHALVASDLKSAKEEGERMGAELGRASEGLFAAETAKLQAEDKKSTLSSQLPRLEKEIEEKDAKLSLAQEQLAKVEASRTAVEERLQESESNGIKAQANIRQLQAELSAAKGRLDVSEVANEVEDLRSQLESEREIRKMVDASNTQISQELMKLRKRYEDATSQKQNSQNEKNELLAAVEPLKLDLEKEKKHRQESDLIISKLEAEISELNDEISQADQSFDKSLGELREKCDSAMKTMSQEIQELDTAKKGLEGSLWKSRMEKEESDRIVGDLQRRLDDSSRSSGAAETGEGEAWNDAPIDTSKIDDVVERLKTATRALQRAEERLRDKDSLVSSLQARLESQSDRINADGKRQKTLASEIEILRTELDRETNKRKALEKDKKKFNSEITQGVDELNKMTAQRDVLLEDKIRLDREVEELKEKLEGMKEAHEHEITAIKIQQQNSVKDLSIRVKEMTDTNQRLKRRTTVVENLLSLKA